MMATTELGSASGRSASISSLASSHPMDPHLSTLSSTSFNPPQGHHHHTQPYDHYSSWSEFESKANATLERRRSLGAPRPSALAAKLASGEVLEIDSTSSSATCAPIGTTLKTGGKHRHRHQLDEARVQLSPHGGEEASVASSTSVPSSPSHTGKTTVLLLTPSPSVAALKSSRKKAIASMAREAPKLDEVFVTGASAERQLREDGLMVGVLGEEEKTFPEEVFGPTSPGSYFESARAFPSSQSPSVVEEEEVWRCRVGGVETRRYRVRRPSGAPCVYRARFASSPRGDSELSVTPERVRLGGSQSEEAVFTVRYRPTRARETSETLTILRERGDDEEEEPVLLLRFKLVATATGATTAPPLLVSLPRLVFTPAQRARKFKVMNPSNSDYVKVVVAVSSSVTSQRLQIISGSERTNEFTLLPGQETEVRARWLDGFDRDERLDGAVLFKVFSDDTETGLVSSRVLYLDARTESTPS